MKFTRFSGALALAVLFVPALAQADDPNDPTMRNHRRARVTLR